MFIHAQTLGVGRLQNDEAFSEKRPGGGPSRQPLSVRKWTTCRW